MSSYEHYLKSPDGYEENEILVEFTVTSWGAPATGPSYYSGGEPAEPPEIEIDQIYIDGEKLSVEDSQWDLLAAEADRQIFEDFDFGEAAAVQPDYDY